MKLYKLTALLNRLLLFLQPASLKNNLILGRKIQLFVPIRADGKGKVTIGDNTSIGYPLAPRAGNGEALIQARYKEAVIEIGENVAFSNNVTLIAMNRISIGQHCLIGDFVTIMDSDFHEVDPLRRKLGSGPSAPVILGKNVWLGSRVIIQKGVTIGDNSIISAQSVVTHDVPPNCIAGGVPAKVIKKI